MGFPRTWLLTTTSPTAAADASRATAALSTPPRAALRHRARRATATSLLTRSIVLRVRAHRAAVCSYPLLRPRTGRHDLDEGRGGTTPRPSASRHVGDIAVKNLRIIGLAVLLLNFRGVGTIHLCSTGVTV